MALVPLLTPLVARRLYAHRAAREAPALAPQASEQEEQGGQGGQASAQDALLDDEEEQEGMQQGTAEEQQRCEHENDHAEEIVAYIHMFPQYPVLLPSLIRSRQIKLLRPICIDVSSKKKNVQVPVKCKCKVGASTIPVTALTLCRDLTAFELHILAPPQPAFQLQQVRPHIKLLGRFRVK